jgi:uncharacterized membrane protein
MVETLLPGISHLQNIHPLVVHFPIAFLIGSGVFYLLALVARKDTLANTAFALLITGMLAAAAAVGRAFTRNRALWSRTLCGNSYCRCTRNA